MLSYPSNQLRRSAGVPPLSRPRGGSDGATSPVPRPWLVPRRFFQMTRCMADSSDRIVPVHFSFSTGFDGELPAVPAPQRAMLHPHRLHISTNRKLLACPWRPCVPARTEKHQENQNPNCACRHGATERCSAGRHCEHVSHCCCLSSTWSIGSALIARCDEDAACS